jgi:hypothetical protein
MLSITLATTALAAAPLYTTTPFGDILSHCVHEVPNGALVNVLKSGAKEISTPNGTLLFKLPPCDTQGGKLSIRRAQPNPLPPDYDGWLQYTSLNASELGLSDGFDAFTSIMSVPDVPKRMADQLFFFPGLQNIDWIPKVDPEPTAATPFDIIQPVLQYPGVGFRRDKWALKSWYVTVNAGALYSKAITVEAGDAILCNMTRTGPQSWSISGALRSDPTKATTQVASNARLQLQPWAYSAVAECYGCDGCETYPKEPIVFSNNSLFQGGKAVVVPSAAWKINAKPAAKLECRESTTVNSLGDATISFQ